MKVTLKLFATLGNFLPPGADRNQIEVDLSEGSSIKDLLSKHNVPMDVCHLILLNGIYNPPAESDSIPLNDGDVVAVWPPIAGG